MSFYNVEHLGQVFTPEFIVSEMLMMRKNFWSILEPSCGDWAFIRHLPDWVGIEIDKRFTWPNIQNMDFFDYSIKNKFDTIIGNPPYVRFQDIDEQTKKKLDTNFFDNRTSLYLFFIKKCIEHLNDKWELIFITPRDFLKATSSIRLNQFIFDNGTITDIIDLWDKKIFGNYTPNCIIRRFEKLNYKRTTNLYKKFVCSNWQLFFTDNEYPIRFSDIFFVKVWAVSGADEIFTDDVEWNIDFVCSYTAKTSKTKKMIYNIQTPKLITNKEILTNRKIKKFDESNRRTRWRKHYESDQKRIYVNNKTRNEKPFFLNNSNFYDGSVLAIFPQNQDLDIEILCDKLNNVNRLELWFVCDGRFIFNQKSLENCVLPESFTEYKIQRWLFDL